MVDDPHIIPLYDADEVGGILIITCCLSQVARTSAGTAFRYAPRNHD